MVIYKLLVSEHLVCDGQSPMKNVSIICAVYGRHMVPHLLEMVIILCTPWARLEEAISLDRQLPEGLGITLATGTCLSPYTMASKK